MHSISIMPMQGYFRLQFMVYSNSAGIKDESADKSAERCDSILV